jgi:hypothetical protein
MRLRGDRMGWELSIFQGMWMSDQDRHLWEFWRKDNVVPTGKMWA